jgi:hypothetical protein
MNKFTRREILQFFGMLFPAILLGFRKKDSFDEELVCVHIFHPAFRIPEPLLTQYRTIPERNKLKNLFQVGIPELLLCSTEIKFLSIFQYFWPITRSEFQISYKQIFIEYQKLELNEKQDIIDFSRYLESNWNGSKREDTKSAIIFTYNDMTKYFASEIISQWQGFGIEELVLFKDPSKPPYLCSYPSLQKGFKRPPPI